MGKVLKFSKNSHKVTGVFRDPGHSHFKLNALLSINTFDENLKKQFSGDWFRMSLYTYVLLPNAIGKAEFEQNLGLLSENNCALDEGKQTERQRAVLPATASATFTSTIAFLRYFAGRQ
jgi:putative ABC transport system permease protein